LIETLPKIADVKILKELSKILIVPMLIAAFIVQTGLSLCFGPFLLAVSPESPFLIQALGFLMIFVLKGLFVGLLAISCHMLLIYLHIFTNLRALKIFAVLFLAFGFLGVFAGGDLVFLKILNNMWFYTAFVMGFYCLAAATDFEEF
jgi:hypothetical protein